MQRKDGRIGVMLPDGTPTLIPTEWTDVGAKATGGDATTSTVTVRFTTTGLRRLLRLVDAMSRHGCDS
ncbi:MAG: hypothetical protein QME96_05515, partial [Myxococcota bacterium]|nr:hypothetical protein [Myxococcota bacterium]